MQEDLCARAMPCYGMPWLVLATHDGGKEEEEEGLKQLLRRSDKKKLGERSEARKEQEHLEIDYYLLILLVIFIA